MLLIGIFVKQIGKIKRVRYMCEIYKFPITYNACNINQGLALGEDLHSDIFKVQKYFYYCVKIKILFSKLRKIIYFTIININLFPRNL